MALGTFVAPAAGNFIKADKFDPRVNANKPLIVKVRDFNPEFSTKEFPEKRPVVFVDLVDLSPVVAKTGQAEVLVSVIWGSAAMVDRLKGYAGTDEKLPLTISSVKSQQTNRTYFTVEPLEGVALKLAGAWDDKNPTAMDDLRAQREAEAEAEGAQNTQDNGPAITGLASGKAAPAASAPAAAPASATAGMSDADLEAAIRDLG